MKVEANSVQEYLDCFPQDQREVLEFLRNFINEHRDKWLQESYRRGMITREVPFSVVPETYNNQPLSYAALARQKNNYALYLSAVYMGDNPWRAEVEKGFQRIGKKPDMGKSCIRFKKLEDIPLEEIANAIEHCTMEKVIDRYKQSRKKS